MAKMHSRKRGRSGSRKPLKVSIPSWIRYKPKEIEMLTLKLAKENKSSSEIGLMLRDSYGVPDARSLLNKKIVHLLAEKKVVGDIPEDLNFLLKNAIKIRKHLEKNKHDMNALRGLTFAESKISRLSKYYKREKRLSQDWKYVRQELKTSA